MTNEEMRKLVATMLSSSITQAQASFLRDAIYLASDAASDLPQPPAVAEKKQVVKTSGVPWLNSELQILCDRFEEWYSATPKKRKAICVELGKQFLRTPGGVKSQFGKIRSQVNHD